jgi:hypothetical protein
MTSAYLEGTRGIKGKDKRGIERKGKGRKKKKHKCGTSVLYPVMR